MAEDALSKYAVDIARQVSETQKMAKSALIDPKTWVPPSMPKQIPRPGELAARAARNLAREAFERLSQALTDFENSLTADEELGGTYVGAPSENWFHIHTVDYLGAELIRFYGLKKDGTRLQLIQHYTQLNVLFMAVPKANEEPRRIGFRLEQQVRDTIIETHQAVEDFKIKPACGKGRKSL